jgi:hypothetical protein
MRERCKLAECEVADKSSKKCKECLKQPKPAAITAWAIKAPDGTTWWVGLSEPYVSTADKDAGYRCVRVRVEEIENTSSRKE